MTRPVDVAPARTRRDREAFIALPYRLHRNDQNWTPLLRRDVRALLSPDNPFFEHGEAQHLLARRGGQVVGRITAISNRLHNELHADRVGFFGFFETVDDPAVAGALFEAAEGWLGERGCDRARGPVSYSMNDEAGLLVDGFDTPSVLMMPHNPRWYVPLVEGAGYVKAKDLLVYQSTHHELPERLLRGADLLQRRQRITTRTLDLERFDREVERVKRLFNAAWERNWGFVPMTDREIDVLARQLRPIVVPDLVVFAERDGDPIGFAVALPDLSVALRRNRSGRLFPGLLKVLWAARRITRVRILLLGAVPEWQGKGVDALLYKQIWENGVRRGYRWGEAGWILEDNHAMRNGLAHLGFEVYKTYRIYERTIGGRR